MPAGASLCPPSLSGLFLCGFVLLILFFPIFFRYKGMSDVISTCEAGGVAWDSGDGCGGVPQDSSGNGDDSWDRGGR